MIPHSLDELLMIQNATYVGGGTDLSPLLKNHVRNDRQLVFLQEISALQGITESGEGIEIGAGVTLCEIAKSERVRKTWPALAQAAQVTASAQIRNVATLGGNVMQDRRCIYFNQSRYWRSALPPCFKTGGTVCHQIPTSPICKAIYYSDMATALLLYEAQAECVESGQRGWVPVSRLIGRHSAANGLSCERHLPMLVLRFQIPYSPEGEASGFFKYSMRSAIDFPLINFALRCNGSRSAKVVVGAVAEQPILLEDTAALLNQAEIPDGDVIICCKTELKRRATLIKEACITPSIKQTLYWQLGELFPLRRQKRAPYIPLLKEF